MSDKASRVRGVRLDPELWDAVVREAHERGITYSDVMREAISEHVKRQETETDE